MDQADYDYRYELGVLCRTWPGGIPQRDYELLLAALHKEMSFRAIGTLVGRFTGQNLVDVYFQANGAGRVAGGPDVVDIIRLVRAGVVVDGPE